MKEKEKLICIKSYGHHSAPILEGHIYIIDEIEEDWHNWNGSPSMETDIQYYSINKHYFTSIIRDEYYIKNYFITMEELSLMRDKKIDEILE